MRTFTHITTDPAVNNGLASIRDTGILVSEVVQRVMAGQSEADVLAAYPVLEHEDVFEALGYAVKDLIQSIAEWKNEGLTSLTSIMSYSALSLGKHAYNASQDFDIPNFNDETRQQFLETIYARSFSAVAAWRYLRSWSYSAYEQSHHAPQKFLIPHLVDTTLNNLSQFAPDISTHVAISPELPPVKCDWSITDALCYLLAGYSFMLMKQEGVLQVDYANDEQVKFVIYREFSGDFRTDEDKKRLVSRAGFRSDPFAIAKVIIRQHGSELDIQVDEGVTFTFSLPVWNETED
ncbi:MAG: DUF433 domain-containing protein [Anaerolineaceae bacterium]|nr:DUF433 domain-containing protein [Anaerolineaceae bacterium]